MTTTPNDPYCVYCGEPVTRSGMADETWFYCECCGGALRDDEVRDRPLPEDEPVTTVGEVMAELRGERFTWAAGDVETR